MANHGATSPRDYMRLNNPRNARDTPAQAVQREVLWRVMVETRTVIDGLLLSSGNSRSDIGIGYPTPSEAASWEDLRRSLIEARTYLEEMVPMTGNAVRLREYSLTPHNRTPADAILWENLRRSTTEIASILHEALVPFPDEARTINEDLTIIEGLFPPLSGTCGVIEESTAFRQYSPPPPPYSPPPPPYSYHYFHDVNLSSPPHQVHVRLPRHATEEPGIIAVVEPYKRNQRALSSHGYRGKIIFVGFVVGGTTLFTALACKYAPRIEVDDDFGISTMMPTPMQTLRTRRSSNLQNIAASRTSPLLPATTENPFQYDYPLQKIITRINATANGAINGLNPINSTTPLDILVKQKFLLSSRSLPTITNLTNPPIHASAENWKDSTGWVIGVALAIVLFSVFVAARCLCCNGFRIKRRTEEERALDLENAYVAAHSSWYS